jgi:alkanesulfonate monooxygenase SsuD/methylene tetrahydromethanopterin reductase-like flavin-dependent oxidoreductase (luciferase family)
MALGKLKFGVFLPFYAFEAKTSSEYFGVLKNIVLECENLGYDAVWLDDHLMYGDWQILEPWTTLSALSTLTSKIRLGTMVTCNAHRNPALLAKTAATLDVISNGRLELGIGAGCQETEHLAYGFDFPKPNVRLAQLGEALEVITRLWTQKKANYQGKYFTLKDAVCEPKPLQKPYPTITVGGSGEKLTPKITAKYAGRFDWGSLLSVEDYRHKLGVLEEQCKLVDRDFDEIERSCWPGGQVLIAKNQKELDELVSKRKPEGSPLEEYRKGNLFATPEQCMERLQGYVDLGVTYFMLYFGDLPNTDSLRLFSESVAKKMC